MRKRKEPEIPEEVECSYCGNVQSDMGRNVACEECGEWPMPSPSADRAKEGRAKPEVKE